jgi:RNA polymerase subunit RPABC4/transcription elongation factor Spt4
MKKKVCRQCNLEFDTDLDTCPVCGRHLFDLLEGAIVATAISKDDDKADHSRD